MKKEIKQIDINKGCTLCPYCESANYERIGVNPIDDVMIVDCFCDGCNKDFKEYFEVVEQHYEVEE